MKKMYRGVWLLCLILLTSCSSQSNTSLAPIAAAARAHITLVVCLDALPGYPSNDFQQATNFVADYLASAIRPNEDGFSVFINLITTNSYAPAAAVQHFTSPALAADPTPPPKNNNVYGQQQDQQKYQTALMQAHQQIDRVKTQLAPNLAALRALHPASMSPGSEDIWGCWVKASEYFRDEHTGEKWLVLATSLANASTFNRATISLTGVHVRYINLVCQNAAQCDQNRADWGSQIRQMGVKDLIYYAPEELNQVTLFSK